MSLVANIAFALISASLVHADIWRLSSDQNAIEVIPGTEGISPAPGVDLSGWNSETQNLRGAMLGSTDLSGANFSQSWLDGVSFGESILNGANLSSASLTGGDFRRADLTAANLSGADLTEVQFGAKLTGADLTGAKVEGATFYDRPLGGGGTVHPRRYAIEGFTAEHIGDFDSNGQLDREDYGILERRVFDNHFGWKLDIFDLDGDEEVNQGDLRFWMTDVKRAFPGDSNLDGEFNSGDLTEVFKAGEYEDNITLNSTWASSYPVDFH